VAEVSVGCGIFCDTGEAFGDLRQGAGGAEVFGEDFLARDDIGEGVVGHVDAEDFGGKEGVEGGNGVGDDGRDACEGEL